MTPEQGRTLYQGQKVFYRGQPFFIVSVKDFGTKIDHQERLDPDAGLAVSFGDLHFTEPAMTAPAIFVGSTPLTAAYARAILRILIDECGWVPAPIVEDNFVREVSHKRFACERYQFETTGGGLGVFCNDAGPRGVPYVEAHCGIAKEAITRANERVAALFSRADRS